jgi:ribose/xylose/arabinose/galactoside ABC-type transport system permease subunit
MRSDFRLKNINIVLVQYTSYFTSAIFSTPHVCNFFTLQRATTFIIQLYQTYIITDGGRMLFSGALVRCSHVYIVVCFAHDILLLRMPTLYKHVIEEG